MKISKYLAVGLLVISLTPVFGQPSPKPATDAPALTKFNLDFPGGTPKELVAAIQKAMGKPLNAIIAEEHANLRLPPIKLNGVTVPELFSALREGSYGYRNNQMGQREVISSYGFETDARQPSDDSIWRVFSYNASQAAPTRLTKFDLDFPGGTPRELVAAIKKATGKPLNAIIPDEYADTKLSALKMNNVDLSQLFQALAAASHKSEAVITGTGSPYGPSSYQIASTSCGFRQGSAEGWPSDDTIWYFYVEKPTLPPLSSLAKVCRFYSLSPYLERGLTVDDITTAIQTGWKMLGDKDTPAISFHKDTKLLIAVGEPGKLDTIDAVLKALGPPPQNPGLVFQDRLKQIIKNTPPPSGPVAPAPKLPETPEAGQ